MHKVSTNEHEVQTYINQIFSLLEHVYTQVLMESTSKHVFTIWNSKQIKHEHAIWYYKWIACK